MENGSGAREARGGGVGVGVRAVATSRGRGEKVGRCGQVGNSKGSGVSWGLASFPPTPAAPAALTMLEKKPVESSLPFALNGLRVSTTGWSIAGECTFEQ